MIRICYYSGSKGLRGEMEPFLDKGIANGFGRKSPECALKEFEVKEPKAIVSGFKVLIVEDNLLFRFLLREKIEGRFPSVGISEATDGLEAFKRIEISPPDLIFMDIRLPGENGIDLTRRIKAKYPGIHIIIITAYDLPEYRDASLKFADYFLPKDSSTEDILKLVQSFSQEASEATQQRVR